MNGIDSIKRVIRTDEERLKVMSRMAEMELPITVDIKKGAHVKRSNPQNALQHKWLTEAAQQGDMTYEEQRAYCKLHFGVPILRESSEEYRKLYDERVKPLPYELKLKMMSHPIDAAVTRVMNKKQMQEYLDAVYSHFVGTCGFRLTEPTEGLFYD